MTNQKELKEKRTQELAIMIEKGKIITEFEKTKAYKLIFDWVEKESNPIRLLAEPKETRDDLIGYIRFGQSLMRQLKVWKNIGDKKNKELIDLNK